MIVYLMDKQAFVDIKNGMKLCIGTEAEAKQANEQRIIEMVREALAWSDYRRIDTGKNWTIQ